MIFYNKDILSTKTEFITDISYDKLIDFLSINKPNGFIRPTDIFINDIFIEVENYDTELNKDDVILIISKYADPVSLAVAGVTVLTYVAKAVIAYGVGWAINELFPPDEAKQKDRNQSDVYNLNSKQNIFKKGQIIPIIYGQVRTYPSLIANTYTRYTNNQEYTYQLMLLSQGICGVLDFRLGETRIPFGNKLRYRTISDEVAFSNIESYIFTQIGDSDYRSNTRTLENPTNLIAKDTESTYYEVSQGVFSLEVDYTYPQGLYEVNSSGNYINYTSGLIIKVYTENAGVYTLIHTTTTADTDKTPESKGITYDVSFFTLEPAFVTFTRATPKSSNTSKQDSLYIKRVKEIFPLVDYSASGTNVGNVTMLWAKIKADEVTTDAEFSINCIAQRGENLSRIRDVVTDIYTNTSYGGAFPNTDLIMSDGTEPFNGAFTSALTIKDALDITCNSQRYSVILNNMNITVKKDDVQPVVTTLFNEGNIIRDSLSINYNYREPYSTDGVSCVYFELNGEEKFGIYPLNSMFPRQVDLKGVNNYTVALAMATYLYKKELAGQKTIVFKTDIQGVIPNYLDRIKVAHNVSNGFSGTILEIDGVLDQITISDYLGLPPVSGVLYLRHIDSTIKTFNYTTVSDYVLQLEPNDVFTVMKNQLFTIENGQIEDMQVVRTKQSGDKTVDITCITYDPSIYN